MEAGATTRSGDRPDADGVLALGVGDASATRVDAAHAADSGHPSPARYVFIALVLAVITGVEVLLYYINLAPGLLVALLLALALVKFVMVVSWFMHLKFDSRLLRRLFVTGIVLAVSVFTVVLLTFHVLIG